MFNPHYFSTPMERPMAPTPMTASHGHAEVHVNKDKFQVRMDVVDFSPDELLVKTKDNFLVIEGHHDEKEDDYGCFIYRSFRRKFLLPPNTEKDNVTCEISRDGELKATVRRTETIQGEKVHAIRSVTCCPDNSRSSYSVPPPFVLPPYAHGHHSLPFEYPMAIVPRTGHPELHMSKEKLEVKMSAPTFSPDELVVKTMGNFLVIEGKHGEKEDEHGFVSRAFKRKYLLPPNIDRDQVDCEISKDGQLKVTVKRTPEIQSEKVYAIKQTGKSGTEKCCEGMSKCSINEKA